MRVLLDGLVALWAAGWIAVGVVAGVQVSRLGEVGDQAQALGRAVQQAGGALGEAPDLPFVGPSVDDAGRRLEEAGTRTIAAGRESAGGARRLAVVLGSALALAPVVPVLALYVPWRVAARRRRAAVRRALGREPWLDEWLARRGVAELPLDRLRAVTDDPWLDLAVGRFEPLARAELERLGFNARGRARRARSPGAAS